MVNDLLAVGQFSVEESFLDRPRIWSSLEKTITVDSAPGNLA
jgi:hypothetical protein